MNKKQKISIGAIAVITAILPVLAFAQIGGTPPTLNLDLTTIGTKIANAAWIIFTIIAVIMFIVAGILFLTSQGDPEKITKARSAFIWGVAGIVVGIIAFTIITIVKSIF